MPSVGVRAKWLGRNFDKRLRAHRAANLGVAADFLRDEIKSLITITKGSYRPPVHSGPFRPPYYITQNLAKSFRKVVRKDDLVAQVGSNLAYARYLEYGTSIMKPRPFILRTLLTRENGIANRMCKSVSSGIVDK